MTDGEAIWIRELLAVLTEPDVDEVLVNGVSSAWAVTSVGPRPLPRPFESEEALLDGLFDFAASCDVRLDPVIGAAGGTLRGGAVRWHALLPPLSRDGPLLTLRRHRFEHVGLGDFAADPGQVVALVGALSVDAPLLIAGPTGSGKTTLLHALLKEQASEERIVIIETIAELAMPSPFSIRLLARPPALDGRGAVDPSRLFAEALRLRPDRVVLGELRGAEATAFLAAAGSGHGAVLATIHAASAEAAVARLKALAGSACESSGVTSVTVAMMARGAPPRLVDVRSVGLVG